MQATNCKDCESVLVYNKKNIPYRTLPYTVRCPKCNTWWDSLSPDGVFDDEKKPKKVT